MAKNRRARAAVDPSPANAAPEKGARSKDVSQDIIDKLYEGSGVPYDKTLETIDEEALWQSMENDAQATDLKTLLEQSMEKLTIRGQKAYDTLIEPSHQATPGPSSPSHQTDNQPVVSGDIDTILNDTAEVEAEDEGGEDTSARKVAWKPVCDIGKKTVYLVRQYESSIEIKVEIPPVADGDTYDVEWIGALGLLEGKKDECFLRLNLKWVGYPVSENTWEPLSNLGEETVLPETKEEMKRRCREFAEENELDFVDEDQPAGGASSSKRAASAASSGKGKAGAKRRKR